MCSVPTDPEDEGQRKHNMARLDVPEGEGLEASRVWKLAPNLRDGMTAMSKAIYENSSLPIREREVARMRIAQLNQCDV